MNLLHEQRKTEMQLMPVPKEGSLVAPVGFEPNVAGVKGRLPDQLEEGTKSFLLKFPIFRTPRFINPRPTTLELMSTFTTF